MPDATDTVLAAPKKASAAKPLRRLFGYLWAERSRLVGVVVPFALGWLVAAWLLPDSSPFVHAFLGATLTATSVGITAPPVRDAFLRTLASLRPLEPASDAAPLLP